ncbi:hypothetical protein CNBD5890 [Cryptococcus deneoformans B-3501A]|uniref:hypothetical protein n=1 Tax=Cryptococcus deneoformans (strain B-3501A) TaxID=283643 RepID=UPI000042E6E0|nr:hypothetical protein CNBD5890 [Cryptococcus neoformans var. neoformans B-3501A]EAL20988.1 hypothetical protein CNBD5890 [Cryptococcus neoformans var. neoformans B-3501A]
MSSTWREFMSWNKYTSIASRALRQALNETDRVAAEKRAVIGVCWEGDEGNMADIVGRRYQLWENGQSGESNYVVPPPKEAKTSGKPSV